MKRNRESTGWATALGPWELAAVGVSAAIASFLLVDPVVLGAVRGFDPGTYTIFRSLTHLGRSHWILIPVGLGILVLYWQRARETGGRRDVMRGYAIQLLVFVFAAIAVSGLAASLIKNVIGRARPKLFDTLGPFEFQPMTFDADFASFPSGHATTAGALAAILAILWPGARIPFFIAGAWIASTRLFIGAHFLSDVVAGFIFGAATVYFMRGRLARQRWLFRLDGDGKPALRARAVLDRGIARLRRRVTGLIPSAS